MLGHREPASIFRLLLWRFFYTRRGEPPSGNGVASGVACTLRRNTRSVRGDAMKAIPLAVCKCIRSLFLFIPIRGFYFGLGVARESLRPRFIAEIKYHRASPDNSIDRSKRGRAFTFFDGTRKLTRREGNGDPLRHSIFSVPCSSTTANRSPYQKIREASTRLDELDTKEVLRFLAYPWL